MISTNRNYFILLGIIAIVFLLCNIYTPFLHDDYAYCYYYGPDSDIIRPTSQRITTLWEVFGSQANHYCFVNGRVTSLGLTQIFCALLGKPLFNIANTLVFILFLDLLVRTVTQERRKASVLLIAYVFYLFLLPMPGQTVFWITGSLNYLWAMAFGLWILRYVQQQRIAPTRHPVWTYPLAGLIGLFCGWMNESITFGIAGGLFLYFLIHRSAFKGNVIPLSIGYFIGTVAILVSPGTLSRFSESGEVNTGITFIPFILSHSLNLGFTYIKYLLPLLATFLLLFFLFNKKARRHNNSLYTCVFLAMSGLLFLLGMPDDRIYFGVCTLSFILVFRYLYTKYNHVSRIGVAVLACLGIYQSVQAGTAIYQYHLYDQKQLAQVEAAPSACVIPDIALPPASKYTYVTGISPDRHAYHNRVKAFYFHKEFIQSIPPALYEHYTDSAFLNGAQPMPFQSNLPDIAPHVWQWKDDPYWVIPISSDNLHPQKINATYHQRQNTIPLKWYQKTIRTLLDITIPQQTPKGIYYIERQNSSYIIAPTETNIEKFSIPILLNSKEALLTFKIDTVSVLK